MSEKKLECLYCHKILEKPTSFVQGSRHHHDGYYCSLKCQARDSQRLLIPFSIFPFGVGIILLIGVLTQKTQVYVNGHLITVPSTFLIAIAIVGICLGFIFLYFGYKERKRLSEEKIKRIDDIRADFR